MEVAEGNCASKRESLTGESISYPVVTGWRGKASNDSVDPNTEEAYWRDCYAGEPYYEIGLIFDDYAAAYRIGYQGRDWSASGNFAAHEREFEATYNRVRGASRLQWNEALMAVRAAWTRVERTRLIPAANG